MVHDMSTPYPMIPVAIAVNFVIVAIIYVLHQHNIKTNNTQLDKSMVYNETCDNQGPGELSFFSN